MTHVRIKSDKDKEVNVQVLLRCRPPNADEIKNRIPTVLKCNEATREVTLAQNIASKQIDRTFAFDKVFGTDASQEQIYDDAMFSVVQEALEGFNCTIFAYGQTGTGKTFTMGTEGGAVLAKDGNLAPNSGVIPRAVKHIFTALENADSEYSIKVTFLELYNEEITDLLACDARVHPGDKQAKLGLCEDGKGGVLVRGLEEEIVRNQTEILSVLERGTAQRRTAETQLNKQSSRSHSVLTITIHIKETTAEGEELIKVGKLNLVDLAGSENISRSGARDGRAREAGEINKSLLTLGRVISALVEQQSYVPYRDSKLTRLLRESLGGKTKTCIVATVSPCLNSLEETLSTLDYAHRAKNIRNKPEVNQKTTKTALLKEMNQEIEKLKLDLLAAREKDGVFMSKDRHDEREAELESGRVRVKELEETLELKEKQLAEVQNLFNSKQQQLEALTEQHEETAAELQSAQEVLEQTSEKLDKAKVGIEERNYLIAAHEHSEESLVSHTGVLAGGLSSAASEVERLYGKLERVNTKEVHNAGVLEELKQEVRSKLATLETAAESAVTTQCGVLERSATELRAFMVRKEGEMEALRGHLQSLMTGVGQNMELLAAVGKAACAETCNTAADVRDTQEARRGEVLEAAQSLNGKCETALNQMEQTLQGGAAEMQTFASMQQAVALDSLGRVRSMTARMRESLAGLESQAEELHAVAAQRASASDSALTGMVSQLEAAAREEQAALLSSVTQLVAGVFSRNQQAIADAAQHVQQEMRAGTEDVVTRVESLQAGLVAASASSSTWDAAAQVAQEEADAGITKSHGAIAEALRMAQAGCLDMRSVVGAGVESVATLHSASSTEAAKKVQDIQARAQADAAELQHCVAGTQQIVASAAESLHAALDGAHSADSKLTGEQQAQASAAGEQLAAFGEQHIGAVRGMQGLVECGLTEAMKQAPVTGETPMKKSSETLHFEIPGTQTIESLRTPRPEVVLAEFRRQQEMSQVVQEESLPEVVQEDSPKIIDVPDEQAPGPEQAPEPENLVQSDTKLNVNKEAVSTPKTGIPRMPLGKRTNSIIS
ncbi:hypothetical protein CYMTET_24764 [Cymbomonas tetramitiformis]|uniref:Kinesin motor domain-containing protein n=1 Tax=Cymbomonas tetramitiformis TaxID=36881 RepID=A0AAE0FW02_9CHLO|nr:hypothetical protein CYMTET_24764 [Cymbomonas tetramitiformis]